MSNIILNIVQNLSAVFRLSDKLLNIVISIQLCSTHENQELLASTVENFGTWLHAHVVHYLVEEVAILMIFCAILHQLL